MNSLNFGQAIEALKNGKKVSRMGWNGKNMWVALTPGSTIKHADARNGAAVLLASETSDNISICGHIDMKAADGSLVIGWLASQTDILAEDWGIIE